MASQTILNTNTTASSAVIPISGLANLACQATVRGSGAVSATVTWYANVDGTADEWVSLGTTFCNGTNVASDGFAAPLKPWAALMCSVSAVTGTGAYVVCKIGW